MKKTQQQKIDEAVKLALAGLQTEVQALTGTWADLKSRLATKNDTITRLINGLAAKETETASLKRLNNIARKTVKLGALNMKDTTGFLEILAAPIVIQQGDTKIEIKTDVKSGTRTSTITAKLPVPTDVYADEANRLRQEIQQESQTLVRDALRDNPLAAMFGALFGDMPPIGGVGGCVGGGVGDGLGAA